MLVACRLAGLSALGAHYAGVRARAQFGLTRFAIASIRAEHQAFRAMPARRDAQPHFGGRAAGP
jgi:hypothetical protein